MCGRFELTIQPQILQEYFDLLRLPDFPLRYNIPPTTHIVTIRVEDGQRIGTECKWGLVPAWSQDSKRSASMINARSETVVEKPSFRTAIKKRRCLIPMTGFYEWFRIDEKPKQAWHISMANGNPLAVAGLWEVWHDGQADRIESCCVITTDANASMAPIHDRMPCLLARDEWDAWLDPDIQDPAAMAALLRPCPDDWLKTKQVSNYVNSVKNQGPECVAVQE